MLTHIMDIMGDLDILGIDMEVRYHSRFFVQVGHETTFAVIENNHFFTIPCRQTYQNDGGPL